jgi:hypothetical protein
MSIRLGGYGNLRGVDELFEPDNQPATYDEMVGDAHIQRLLRKRRSCSLEDATRPGPNRREARSARLDGPRRVVRCRLNRLSHVDVRTGEPISRYEHDYPSSLIHVDVKKLGCIPDGGG